MKDYRVQQVTPDTSFSALLYPQVELLAIEDYLVALQAITQNKFCFAHNKSLFETFRRETVRCYEGISQLKDRSPAHHTLYVFLLNLRRMFHTGLNHYFLNKQSYLFDLKQYCREGLILVHEMTKCN